MKSAFKLIEFRFLPYYIFVFLPIMWVISHYELFYLLNDEIIFDFILLVLVIFINSLLSNMNYKSYITEQNQYAKLSILILYYLVTSRYFLLRKKKYEDANMIIVIDYLINIKSTIFKQYTATTYHNIISDIKDRMVYKLKTVVSMKQIELLKSIKQSYKNKIFILI